jgi:hypothetical protein
MHGKIAKKSVMGTSGCMLIAAAALSAACLASPWAGEVVAAEPASARAAGAVGAPIAWCACAPGGARVRPSPRAARLGPPAPADDRARGVHHLASKAEQRIGSTLIDPGGPGDTGVGLVRGGPDARVAMLQRLCDLRPESVGPPTLRRTWAAPGGVGPSMQLGGQEPDSSAATAALPNVRALLVR